MGLARDAERPSTSLQLLPLPRFAGEMPGRDTAAFRLLSATDVGRGFPVTPGEGAMRSMVRGAAPRPAVSKRTYSLAWALRTRTTTSTWVMLMPRGGSGRFWMTIEEAGMSMTRCSSSR